MTESLPILLDRIEGNLRPPGCWTRASSAARRAAISLSLAGCMAAPYGVEGDAGFFGFRSLAVLLRRLLRFDAGEALVEVVNRPLLC